jgi:DNA mismatch repair protein MutS2
LISGLLQLVETENAKRKKQTAAAAKKKKAEKIKVKTEVAKKVEEVRDEKKKQPAPKPKKRPKVDFRIGDQVRLYDGKAVGSIDSLEKDKAIVNYGMFTTQVKTESLELVQRA